MSVICYKCKNEIQDLAPKSKIGKEEECPSCKVSLKCCSMCVFYDPHSYNECKEPVAERIVDKEKANFCDYFELGSGGNISDNNNDLIAEASKLFKF